jgi:hypothetical protein
MVWKHGSTTGDHISQLTRLSKRVVHQMSISCLIRYDTPMPSTTRQPTYRLTHHHTLALSSHTLHSPRQPNCHQWFSPHLCLPLHILRLHRHLPLPPSLPDLKHHLFSYPIPIHLRRQRIISPHSHNQRCLRRHRHRRVTIFESISITRRSATSSSVGSRR